jgi:hypothetical protein
MTKVLPAKVSSYVGCQKPIFCVSDGDLARFVNQNNLGRATNGFDYATIHKSLYSIHEDFTSGNFNQFLTKQDYFQSDRLLNQLEKLI